MLEIRNFTQNEIDEKIFYQAAEKTFKIVKKEHSDWNLSKDSVEISLAVVGEGRMRRLNKMYRGKNRVTDVLAFEYKPNSSNHKPILFYLAKAFPRSKKGEDMPVDESGFVGPPDEIKRLGEIVICYPRAKKQAKRLDHPLEKELVILLVHGILHLLGYDHEKDEEEAKKMEDLQERIVTNF